jgi:hypothetical protein
MHCSVSAGTSPLFLFPATYSLSTPESQVSRGGYSTHKQDGRVKLPSHWRTGAGTLSKFLITLRRVTDVGPRNGTVSGIPFADTHR